MSSLNYLFFLFSNLILKISYSTCLRVMAIIPLST